MRFEHGTQSFNVPAVMIVARVLDPRSKLTTAQGLDTETMCSSPSELLDVGECDEDEWHMRRALAPILFDDRTPDAPDERASAVAPVQLSSAAARKARTKRTDDSYTVQSLRQVLTNLGTITIRSRTSESGRSRNILQNSPSHQPAATSTGPARHTTSCNRTCT